MQYRRRSITQQPVRMSTAISAWNGRARHEPGGGDGEQDQPEDHEEQQHPIADLPARIARRGSPNPALRPPFGSIGHRLS
jgi:hypothetical protein